MRRHPHRFRASCLVVGTSILLWASPAAAQLFQLGEWEGALEGVVDFIHVDTKGSASGSTSESFRSEERLTLRNVGAFVYDPGLVTLNLGGTIGLSQDRLSSEDKVTSATTEFFREGTLWGYDAYLGLLPERPYSLSLFANRSEYFLTRELAGETRVQTENRGAVLNAFALYIPSTLTVQQTLRDDETRTAGLPTTHVADKRSVLTYRGLRGWIDSEMDVRYEFIDYKDEIFPTLNRQTHEGTLNYTLDFGTELNWHWDSRLRAFSQAGFSPFTTYSADESVRIEHTERLQTSYRYSFQHLDSPAGTTTTHSAAFGLRHLPYNNLTTVFELSGSVQSPPGGERDFARTRLDFTYTRGLPWEGRIRVGGGGLLEYENDRFSVSESSVSQELHTATNIPFDPITLNNPLVVTDSVVVTKVGTGPLPIGCIPPPGPPTPLVLGTDYTLQASGSFTQIVPIPCSGLRPGINPGDTIAVDYRFGVSPALSFYTVGRHVDVSLDYQWVRPYISHERIEQTLLSGQDGRFLDNRETNIGGIEFRYSGQWLQASLLGEARRQTGQRQTFDSVRSAQFLGASITPELILSLTADEEQIEFKNPTHTTRIVTGRSTVTYLIGPNLTSELRGGLRWFRDSLLPTERTIEAALRMRWFFRKLEVQPTLEFFDLQRGETDTKEYRASVHVIRRF